MLQELLSEGVVNKATLCTSVNSISTGFVQYNVQRVLFVWLALVTISTVLVVLRCACWSSGARCVAGSGQHSTPESPADSWVSSVKVYIYMYMYVHSDACCR